MKTAKLFRGFGSLLAIALLLGGCGGGGVGGGDRRGEDPATYTVGGSLTGLGTGQSVVLQLNGGDELPLSADGAFTFPSRLADGSPYNVTVKAQPAGQSCMVSSNSGVVSGAAVIGVRVACVTTHMVMGTIEGLSGLGLVLQLNGAHDHPVRTDGAFSFPTRLADGSSYAVTVQAQPTGPEQVCTVTNGRGTLAGADITNVAVRCAWTKQLGVAGAYTLANGVATDVSGNVYVAGYTDGGLDGNPLTGRSDLVLVKYDAAGNKLYSKQLGVAGAYTEAYSVATDVSGNVYVAGYTDGGLDDNPLTGIYGLVLVKYDADGTKLYTRQLGVAMADTGAYGVTTDAQGNVYVAGFTTGSLDGNPLTDSWDLTLVKYDPAGNKLYTQQLGAASAVAWAYSVATDASGNVYVAGTTNGGLDGNPRTGRSDLVLVKYNADGTRLYTRQLGVSEASTEAYGVATDGQGNVYVTGYTTGGLDGNAQRGVQDLFLLKYDAAGNIYSRRQLGAAGASAYAYAVATDAHGHVYVAGYTDGGLDGNAKTGYQDLFLVKYDAAGTRQ